jgi:hypothetical protein
MMEAVWLSTDILPQQLITEVASTLRSLGSIEDLGFLRGINHAEFIASLFHEIQAIRGAAVHHFGISASCPASNNHTIIFIATRYHKVDFGAQSFSFIDIVESDSVSLRKLYRIEDPPRVKEEKAEKAGEKKGE